MEYTIFSKKHSITNYIIPIMMGAIVPFHVEVSLVLPIMSYFVPVSKEGNVEQHVQPTIAEPGEAFCTV
jgi:hypothetical protein